MNTSFERGIVFLLSCSDALNNPSSLDIKPIYERHEVYDHQLIILAKPSREYQDKQPERNSLIKFIFHQVPPNKLYMKILGF